MRQKGAKFWLAVFTDLQHRDKNDCFVACVAGLTGLPEALEIIFPQTQVQLCIVHKSRQSLRYVVWREWRAVARDLRAIYGAATLSKVEDALQQHARPGMLTIPQSVQRGDESGIGLRCSLTLPLRFGRSSIGRMPLNP